MGQGAVDIITIQLAPEFHALTRPTRFLISLFARADEHNVAPMLKWPFALGRQRAARDRLPRRAHRRLRAAVRAVGAARGGDRPRAAPAGRRGPGARPGRSPRCWSRIAFCNPALWWARYVPHLWLLPVGLLALALLSPRLARAGRAAALAFGALLAIDIALVAVDGDGGQRRRLARGRPAAGPARSRGRPAHRALGRLRGGARAPAQPRDRLRRGRSAPLRVARAACSRRARGSARRRRAEAGGDLAAAPAGGRALAASARWRWRRCVDRDLFAAARPAARARHVIYLFMAGGPSQLDLFAPKPALAAHDGQPLPPSVARGERFAFIKGTPRLLASPFPFARHGQSGAMISSLMPHLARVADKVTFLHAVTTTQINHAPAQILMTSGHQIPGRPSFGAWLAYGLGAETDELPAFVVLLSGERHPDGGQALWGNGFLPAAHQGVELRPGTRSGAVPLEPAGDRSPRASRQPGYAEGARRPAAARDRRARHRGAHSQLRAGVSHANLGARARGAGDGAAGHSSPVRHHAGARVVRQPLLARAPPGRARLPHRAALSPRLGQPRREPQRRSPAPLARAVRRDRPGRRGVADRSRPARAARFDAGRVGRRVRAHADDGGARRLEVPRARPPRPRVHGLARGRRHQARRCPTAPATTSATTRPAAR